MTLAAGSSSEPGASMSRSTTVDGVHSQTRPSRASSESTATLAHDAEQGSPAKHAAQSDAVPSGRPAGNKEPDLERGEKVPIIGRPEYMKEQDVADLASSNQNNEKQGSVRKKATVPNLDDPFLITLKGREHINPHTWKANYRWALTLLGGIMVLNATFASSAPSQLIPEIITHFGVSEEVGILTIALFVAGYCIGPLLWGPLSERYGRRPIFLISFLPYVGWNVGAALSPNIGALLVFRLLGGCFAAAPLTNVGGLIADLWDADRRGIALAYFSLAPFAGPAIAPIISGAMSVRGVYWRWIFWVLTIFGGACFIVLFFAMPETYLPVLLHKEAKKKRKETGDERYYTEWEKKQQGLTAKARMQQTVLKPFVMLVQEPMLLLLTLYLSLVYGVIYLLFEAVPIIFQGIHHFNALEGGLVFLTLPVGGAIGVVSYILYFNKRYTRIHKAMAPKPVPPEERLLPLMYCAPALAICFFWLGWTSYESINPAAPILAIVVFGLCVLWQFLGIFNYIIDTYLMNASSALAANTVCRSAFGAGFPLFAGQMYRKLGTPGASSLLGGLAILFAPAPFLLYKYGKRVRMMSKNAVVLDKD